LNYRRWLVVACVLVAMVISVSILLVPGQRYDTLTTSDSGWVYDIAVEISEKGNLVDKNPLSHAPYGWTVSYNEQLQPLLTVMVFHAASAVNSSVTLMDVVKLWGPMLFALSLIPIFLIGREFGGDFAGVAAVFFAATMTSSIYWMKVGAYDREPLKLLLTSMMIFFTIKMFKAPKQDILKYAVLSGLSLGLFSIAWPGGYSFVVIPIGGLIFVLIVGFLGKLVRKFSDLSGAIKAPLKNHSHLIVGVVAMAVVMTVILTVLGKQSLGFWGGLVDTMLGYVGLGGGGGGGAALPAYASEAGVISSNLGDWFSAVFGTLYNNSILVVFVTIMIVLTLVKFVFSRKRWEIFVFAWLLFLLALVFPGMGQSRFTREFWPIIPVLTGVGLATLISLFRRLYSESSLEWLKGLQNPVAVTAIIIIFTAPFISNAYASATVTTPPTEWQGSGLDEGFLESFNWLRENTAESSVVAIDWSYGHLMTGVSRRASVADGVESAGQAGVWEKVAEVRPPDYIYVENASGFLEEHYTINGRRTDVQRFPSISADELAYYLETYWDNYGVKIDYWIAYGYQFYNMIGDIIGQDAKRSQSTTFDQNLIFHFADEDVVFNSNLLEAYIDGADGKSYFTGVVILYYDQSGNFTNFNYNFVADAQIPRILKVYIPSSSSSATLDQIMAFQSHPYYEGPPMYMRVFGDVGGLPDFLSVVFTSSNGLVKVVKVNYMPSAVYPENGSSINDSTPELRSSIAIGATRYEFVLADNPSFSSPIIQTSIDQPRYTTTTPLSDGAYWWRVAAYKGAELIGWSDPSTFVLDTIPPTTPQISEPQYGVELSDLKVSFIWSRPESGADYQVQIYDEADLLSPLQENQLTTENFYFTFQNNGNYLWHVRAFDAAGNASEWSENYRFTVRLPPQAASLASPADGLVTSDNTPSFSWSDGIADNFRLLVDEDGDFSSPILDVYLGTTKSYTPSEALLDDNYSWKVVSIVEAQQVESLVRTFIVDTIAPEIPALLSPDNGEIVTIATPTFVWSNEAGVFRYGIVVDNDQDFGSPLIENWVDGTSFMSPVELPSGTYYWEIFVIDSAGNFNISPTQYFIVQRG